MQIQSRHVEGEMGAWVVYSTTVNGIRMETTCNIPWDTIEKSAKHAAFCIEQGATPPEGSSRQRLLPRSWRCCCSAFSLDLGLPKTRP